MDLKKILLGAIATTIPLFIIAFLFYLIGKNIEDYNKTLETTDTKDLSEIFPVATSSDEIELPFESF